jgi:hypothetical protein
LNPKLTALNLLYRGFFSVGGFLSITLKNYRCDTSQFQKAKKDFLKTIEKYADVLKGEAREALEEIIDKFKNNVFSNLLDKLVEFPGIFSKIISSKAFNVFINQIEELKRKVGEKNDLCSFIILGVIAKTSPEVSSFLIGTAENFKNTSQFPVIFYVISRFTEPKESLSLIKKIAPQQKNLYYEILIQKVLLSYFNSSILLLQYTDSVYSGISFLSDILNSEPFTASLVSLAFFDYKLYQHYLNYKIQKCIFGKKLEEYSPVETNPAKLKEDEIKFMGCLLKKQDLKTCVDEVLNSKPTMYRVISEFFNFLGITQINVQNLPEILKNLSSRGESKFTEVIPTFKNCCDDTCTEEIRNINVDTVKSYCPEGKVIENCIPNERNCIFCIRPGSQDIVCHTQKCWEEIGTECNLLKSKIIELLRSFQGKCDSVIKKIEECKNANDHNCALPSKMVCERTFNLSKMIKAREGFEEVFQKEIPEELLDFIKDDMKKITADENIKCD